jgi:glycosyltransferase involved in cell wall biosynthesis
MNRLLQNLFPLVSFTRSPIVVTSRFLDDQGRPARNVRIRLGKRLLDCLTENESGKFRFVFRTKPGLKHLIIEAELADGTWVKIGQQLVVVYAKETALGNYRLWMQEEPLVNPPPPPPPSGPVISVLMPVYNTPACWLARAIDSVHAQTYPHWELCIADDASTQPHVATLLAGYAAQDPRIKIIRRPVNGHISAASNSALALVTGDFTALLDHDDELAPHALAAIAEAIARHPGARLVYSDEDKIDRQGRRFSANFKPDWNPDLLLAQNYLSHLTVYHTGLLRDLGGFRVGYEGAQDWDLALRAIEVLAATDIVHVPQVLYHWRAIPGSTALKQSQKSYVGKAARRTLADYLERNHIDAEIVPVRGGHWRVRRRLPASPPRVSLIIPTRNRVGLLRTCVESILAATRYPNFEILVIDNGSDDPATLDYLKTLAGRGVKVLRDEGPFNYSALNNRAVAHATGEVLGFLNNDLELITPDWLEEMVSQTLRPEIGAVGAMLYFPDDRVQHAGVVLGIGRSQKTSGLAGHAFKYFPRGHTGSANRMRVLQNYSAVTAACLLVRRELFIQTGGFDEENLAVAYNDVDFCLRLGAAGYRNVWTPFAEFYHHESASRGADDTPEKKAIYEREHTYMRRQWGALLDRDPAYNPNLTLTYEDFSPAWPPRSLSERPSPID